MKRKTAWTWNHWPRSRHASMSAGSPFIGRYIHVQLVKPTVYAPKEPSRWHIRIQLAFASGRFERVFRCPGKFDWWTVQKFAERKANAMLSVLEAMARTESGMRLRKGVAS